MKRGVGDISMGNMVDEARAEFLLISKPVSKDSFTNWFIDFATRNKNKKARVEDPLVSQSSPALTSVQIQQPY